MQRQKRVILTALRLSAYLAILFNWDKNTIYTTDTGLLQSKNLVLETLYAIAYRVQHLIEEHCRAVQTSLSSTNTTSDPATISCALWIVYKVLNGANKLQWKAKSLQNLVRPNCISLFKHELNEYTNICTRASF